MHKQVLIDAIRRKGSYLCVGLDTDLKKIPAFLLDGEDPVFEFNRQVIEATLPYAVAYKLNLAFYECLGASGWESLRKTLELIPQDVMKIADAKRGDIGNTADMYARAFFEVYPFDAITVAPYMGEDSVTPFLAYKEKWVFVLGLTSNPGAADFQYLTYEGEPLYAQVIRKSRTWAASQPGELGFVVGATRTEKLREVRRLAPDNFFLVPGIGAQGGDLQSVCTHMATPEGGLLINASRSIIYASQTGNFAHAAGTAAEELQREMRQFITWK